MSTILGAFIAAALVLAPIVLSGWAMMRNCGRISEDERSGAVEGMDPRRWDEA